MQFAKRDIWELYNEGHDVVVTTNIGWDPRTLANNMGAGTVLQAARAYPELPYWYGEECKRMVEQDAVDVLYRPDLRLFFLPVKPLLDPLDPERSWDQLGDYRLIGCMIQRLGEILSDPHAPSVALTLPGCGNGGLDRKRMLPMVYRELCHLDRVILCDLELPQRSDLALAASS